MIKRIVSFMVAMALALGCGAAMAEMPTADRAGNPLTVPESIEKIISLAPSITQVIVDLGQGEKLVALDKHSLDVEGIPADLPAFDIMTPDMEQIVALAPDIVFVTGMSLSDGQDPTAPLVEMGIPVVYIPSSTSIEGILEDNLFISQVLLGSEEGGQALNDTLMEAVEAYRVETDTPVPVYFEISPMPYLYSFGSGTFLNEMIELLGGENIFAGEEGWISVSEEQVIAAAPEIIFTNVSYVENSVEDIMARAGWESIPAIANGYVYEIDSNASSQPNHRIVNALEEMAKAFEK